MVLGGMYVSKCRSSRGREGGWPLERRSESRGRMSSVVCHLSQVLARTAAVLAREPLQWMQTRRAVCQSDTGSGSGSGDGRRKQAVSVVMPCQTSLRSTRRQVCPPPTTHEEDGVLLLNYHQGNNIPRYLGTSVVLRYVREGCDCLFGGQHRRYLARHAHVDLIDAGPPLGARERPHEPATSAVKASTTETPGLLVARHTRCSGFMPPCWPGLWPSPGLMASGKKFDGTPSTDASPDRGAATTRLSLVRVIHHTSQTTVHSPQSTDQGQASQTRPQITAREPLTGCNGDIM